MPLSIIERHCPGVVALRNRDCQRCCGIDTAAEENDCMFHLHWRDIGRCAPRTASWKVAPLHRPSRPIFFTDELLSGYSARTLSAMPPRAENCAVTIASRGAHAFTKSSRMRLVTASLNARSCRYEAR